MVATHNASQRDLEIESKLDNRLWHEEKEASQSFFFCDVFRY